MGKIKIDYCVYHVNIHFLKIKVVDVMFLISILHSLESRNPSRF